MADAASLSLTSLRCLLAHVSLFYIRSVGSRPLSHTLDSHFKKFTPLGPFNSVNSITFNITQFTNKSLASGSV